jgi:hypothetical protein
MRGQAHQAGMRVAAMGSFRYETYYAGGFLIEALDKAGLIRRMIHDGGDIVLFQLTSGERVSVHLIESALPVYEIRNTLSYNAAQDSYTLFVLWASMMVPRHGQRYGGEDWMEALYTLYDDRIFAYDLIDGDVFIFPAYFRGSGGARVIEYGTTVRAAELRCQLRSTTIPGFSGTWRVATFVEATFDERARRSAQTAVSAVGLEADYTLLGVLPGDDRETIKRAYRLLARRTHPDNNPQPDATDQMQRLNEAYRRIMAALGEGE